MGRDNYLDNFEAWMIRKGKKPKKREIPSEPMAPIGARAKLRLVRRILVDLGYVHSEELKKRKFKYSVWPKEGCKRIESINPTEFTKWTDQEFTYCEDRKDKQRKGAYVIAAWKFGEYLVYGMKDHKGYPVWTKEQLKQLKEETYPPAVEEFEVEILPLPIIDSYIDFLKTQNLKHYTMVYLSRWLGGMRYQEVINAKSDLNSPTLKINFQTDKVTIWGKGRGGMQKTRYPTLSSEVKEVLREYLKHREQLIEYLMDKKRKHPLKEDPGYLFFNQRGKKFPENSGHFNTVLRKHARASGKLTEEEISLISTHRIGRHGFGTYFYPKMKDKVLMKQMGLESERMLRRYANLTRGEEDEMFNQAVSEGNGNRIEEPQPRTDRLSQLKELFSGLSKEEKMQLLAEVIG